jgi:hypothetical protein
MIQSIKRTAVLAALGGRPLGRDIIGDAGPTPK